MFSLLKIKHIRKHLTVQACEVLIHGLVMSHLDYGNSLFFGLPDCNINKLQRVQNAAAKVVLQRRRMDSWTKCFMELHWLPIRACTEHKILMLVLQQCSQFSPKILMWTRFSINLMADQACNPAMNSKHWLYPEPSIRLLQIELTASVVPNYGNKLPTSVKSAPDLDTFKKNLKTHLFVREFTSK